MAARNLCFCILMAVVATNMILAEEEKASFFPFGSIPSFFGFREGPSEDAQGREVAAENAHNEEHSDRFFFGFRRIVSCNYTAQAGSTCSGCRQVLRCYRNNVGILRNCGGLFSFYCNGGMCTYTPGSACNTTSG